MAGLHHSSPLPAEPRDPATERYNSRLGLILFAVYLAIYAGFVLINAFRPDWMRVVPLMGLNLAILWGMGLIVGAAILALAYAGLCRAPQSREKTVGELAE